MSMSAISIDGFAFSIWRGQVVIDDSLNLDDPGAIAALKKAVEAGSTIALVTELHELYDRIGFNPNYNDMTQLVLNHYYDKIDLDMDIAKCENILNQELVEVGEWARRLKQGLRAARASWKSMKTRQRAEAAACIINSRPGYVYLIQSAATSLYKIGKTIDVQNRQRTFSVKLPFEVEMIHTIKCKDYHAAELKLHKRYAEKRVNGEWFNLAPEDIEAIKAIKSL